MVVVHDSPEAEALAFGKIWASDETCLIYSGNCVIQRPCLQLLHISGRAVASANLLCVQTSSADKAVRAHQMLSLNKTTRIICTYEKRLSVLFMKARPLLPVLD